MKKRKTVIVGCDVISSLGSELEEQWQRAIAGESGIGPLTRFPLKSRFSRDHRRAGCRTRQGAVFISLRPASGGLVFADIQIWHVVGSQGPGTQHHRYRRLPRSARGGDLQLRRRRPRCRTAGRPPPAGREQAPPPLYQSQLLHQHDQRQDRHADQGLKGRSPPPSRPVQPG